MTGSFSAFPSGKPDLMKDLKKIMNMIIIILFECQVSGACSMKEGARAQVTQTFASWCVEVFRFPLRRKSGTDGEGRETRAELRLLPQFRRTAGFRYLASSAFFSPSPSAFFSPSPSAFFSPPPSAFFSPSPSAFFSPRPRLSSHWQPSARLPFHQPRLFLKSRRPARTPADRG